MRVVNSNDTATVGAARGTDPAPTYRVRPISRTAEGSAVCPDPTSIPGLYRDVRFDAQAARAELVMVDVRRTSALGAHDEYWWRLRVGNGRILGQAATATSSPALAVEDLLSLARSAPDVDRATFTLLVERRWVWTLRDAYRVPMATADRNYGRRDHTERAVQRFLAALGILASTQTRMPTPM